MSFSFGAAGSREEVLSSLFKLNNQNLGGDGLGAEIRDDITEAIEAGADPGPSQRYVINASGHSGSRSLVTLNVSVTVEPATQPVDATATQEVPVTDTDTLTPA